MGLSGGRPVGSAESEYQCIQVALNDHVLDRSHCLLQQIGIRGIGVVNVHLLLWLSYKIAEFVGKELLSRFDVVGSTGVVWEDLVDWAHATHNFFSE